MQQDAEESLPEELEGEVKEEKAAPETETAQEPAEEKKEEAVETTLSSEMEAKGSAGETEIKPMATEPAVVKATRMPSTDVGTDEPIMFEVTCSGAQEDIDRVELTFKNEISGETRTIKGSYSVIQGSENYLVYRLNWNEGYDSGYDWKDYFGNNDLTKIEIINKDPKKSKPYESEKDSIEWSDWKSTCSFTIAEKKNTPKITGIQIINGNSANTFNAGAQVQVKVTIENNSSGKITIDPDECALIWNTYSGDTYIETCSMHPADYSYLDIDANKTGDIIFSYKIGPYDAGNVKWELESVGIVLSSYDALYALKNGKDFKMFYGGGFYYYGDGNYEAEGGNYVGDLSGVDTEFTIEDNPNADTTPFKIRSVVVENRPYTPGSTVPVTIYLSNAAQKKAPLDCVDIIFSQRNGDGEFSVYDAKPAKNPDGSYTVNVLIQPTTPEGSYYLYNACTYDAAGNYLDYWGYEGAENKIFENGTKVDAVTLTVSKQIRATGVSVSAVSKKLAAGKKVKMTATVYPAYATNKAVTWKSSKPKYATVDAYGNVKFKKAGAGKKVTITATAADGSGKSGSIKISIMKNAVKSISLKASKKVKAGKKVKVKATVKTNGKKANKKLRWSSSNTAYATVSQSGKVSTKKAGKGKTVAITAAATDGSNKKKTIKIKLK